jgi:hypothetical protein
MDTALTPKRHDLREGNRRQTGPADLPGARGRGSY